MAPLISELLKWPLRIATAALVMILLPVALILGIWQTIRGGAKSTPNKLAELLRGASEGSRGHWDELECVPLRDEGLEAIRREALKVSLPLTPEGKSKLMQLAEQAEGLNSRHN